jgi:Tfp pilus assembly protein PilN
MSLDFLTRPIGGSRKKDKDTAVDDAPKRGTHGQVPPVPAAPVGTAGAALSVGASPRVDLMPPEIRLKRTQLRTRRSLRMLLVGVVIVTAVACGGAFAWNTVTQTSLVLAQAQQQALIQQQAKFGPVTTVSQEIALVQAGQRVASSTEVQWAPYIDQLRAALPQGTTLLSVSVDSASPVSTVQQPTAPLQGGRIATLQIETRSGQLPSVADLLTAISTLPGYADASPGQVTSTDGIFQTSITMHVGTAALDNRYTKAGK